jgi:G3E family GTPase
MPTTWGKPCPTGSIDRPALALQRIAVIVLVDAAAAIEQAGDPRLADTLERQLRAADLVVLNKIDRVDAAQRLAVQGWVRSVAGATPQFETTQAVLPAPLLGALAPAVADPPQRRHDDGPDAAHAHVHAHDPEHDHEHDELFETWSMQTDAPLSASALRQLLKQMPEGVLRLKGLVRSDEHGWSELQFAGKHGSLRRAAGSTLAEGAVVAIGLRGRLPRETLASAFAAAAQRPAR